jgi:hypothetical protein
MKICPGTIIWKSTSEKHKSLPLNFNRPNAYPAVVAVSTAQIILPKIINNVLIYSLIKSIFRTTFALRYTNAVPESDALKHTSQLTRTSNVKFIGAA